MKNIDSAAHTRGESIYLDDIPLIQGTLFGAVFGSPVAHGIIRKLDVTEAEKLPGVVRVLTYKEVRGENQIGGIVPDEPLFAEGHVHVCGMPVAFVVADSEGAARAALKKIVVEIEPLAVFTDPRVAQARGGLYGSPRTFQLAAPYTPWT